MFDRVTTDDVLNVVEDAVFETYEKNDRTMEVMVMRSDVMPQDGNRRFVTILMGGKEFRITVEQVS